jgi:hypothetical protein
LATIGPRENTITNYFPIKPNRSEMRTATAIGMGDPSVLDDESEVIAQDIPAESLSIQITQRAHVSCLGVLRGRPDECRHNVDGQKTMTGGACESISNQCGTFGSGKSSICSTRWRRH